MLESESVLMGHAHWSVDCACCSAMGVRQQPVAELKTRIAVSRLERVDTDGLDDLYTRSAPSAQEPAPPLEATPVSSESVEVSIETQDVDERLEALLQLLRGQSERLTEQASRLEAAHYRIGYLEAQVEARDAELDLLPDLRWRAAHAIANNNRIAELETKVKELESALRAVRNRWWNRFMCWLLGLEDE